MGSPAHFAADQPCALENLDMLRGRRERDGEWLRKLADRLLAAGELAQHLPAGRIAKGVKDRGELGRI